MTEENKLVDTGKSNDFFKLLGMNKKSPKENMQSIQNHTDSSLSQNRSTFTNKLFKSSGGR